MAIPNALLAQGTPIIFRLHFGNRHRSRACEAMGG